MFLCLWCFIHTYNAWCNKMWNGGQPALLIITNIYAWFSPVTAGSLSGVCLVSHLCLCLKASRSSAWPINVIIHYISTYCISTCIRYGMEFKAFLTLNHSDHLQKDNLVKMSNSVFSQLYIMLYLVCSNVTWIIWILYGITFLPASS